LSYSPVLLLLLCCHCSVAPWARGLDFSQTKTGRIQPVRQAPLMPGDLPPA